MVMMNMMKVDDETTKAATSTRVTAFVNDLPSLPIL